MEEAAALSSGRFLFARRQNAIEALQQLCGNLFSALLVPIAELAAQHKHGLPMNVGVVSGDDLVLSAVVIGALAYFVNFNSVSIAC